MTESSDREPDVVEPSPSDAPHAEGADAGTVAASTSDAPHASTSDADATTAPDAAEVDQESETPSEDEEWPEDDGEVVNPVEEPAAEEPVAEEPAAPTKPKRRARGAKEETAEDKPVEKPAAKPAAKPAPTRRRRTAREPGAPIPVVRAQAKYVRSSARKARLVCDNIRGKTVDEARAILAHTPRAVAKDWSKLLESAVANAEHNHELVGEDLYVKAVTADEGPTIKRFRPRAMGRATKIRKRTAHLTILLTPKD
jgi:ribosomal protein L22